jgi:hypothetical protein
MYQESNRMLNLTHSHGSGGKYFSMLMVIAVTIVLTSLGLWSCMRTKPASNPGHGSNPVFYSFKPNITSFSYKEQTAKREISFVADSGQSSYAIEIHVELAPSNTDLSNEGGHQFFAAHAGSEYWIISSMSIAKNGVPIEVPDKLYNDLRDISILGISNGIDIGNSLLIVRIIDDGALQMSILSESGPTQYLVHWWFNNTSAASRHVVTDTMQVRKFSATWFDTVPIRK